MKEEFKQHLLSHLVKIGSDTFGRNITDRKSNVGKYLSDIYTWQETIKYAKERYDEAWKKAQLNGGPIADDDNLRELGKGEHIVTESNSMSCIVTVQDPRRNFSKEKFIALIAKQHKIPVAELESLAERAYKETAPPLSKRVVEA